MLRVVVVVVVVVAVVRIAVSAAGSVWPSAWAGEFGLALAPAPAPEFVRVALPLPCPCPSPSSSPSSSSSSSSPCRLVRTRNRSLNHADSRCLLDASSGCPWLSTIDDEGGSDTGIVWMLLPLLLLFAWWGSLLRCILRSISRRRD